MSDPFLATSGAPRYGPLIGITAGRADDPSVAKSAYQVAVIEAGGVPIPIPMGLDQRGLHRLLGHLDGILLSGGGDIGPQWYGAAPSPFLRGQDAERDALEITLARLATRDGRPVLGICRGLQVLNVALGGTLIQDIASEVHGALRHDHPDLPGDVLAHGVEIGPGLLHTMVDGIARLETNSSHHQAAGRLGDGLTASGQSPDGIVEALELPGAAFALAVQWHPERLRGRPEARALFRGLIDAARRG